MSSTFVPLSWLIISAAITIAMFIALLVQCWITDRHERQHSDQIKQLLAAFGFEKKAREMVQDKLVNECGECARLKAALDLMVREGMNICTDLRPSGIVYMVSRIHDGIIGSGRSPHEALLKAVDNITANVVSIEQAAS